MFGLILFFACSEKTEGLPEITIHHYDATSLITLEESGMEFEERYWVRRTSNPDERTILEEFVSGINGALITYTYRVDVEAKTFEIEFSDVEYSGDGSFVGDGLHWSSWSSTSTHQD